MTGSNRSFDASAIARTGNCAGCGLCATVAPLALGMQLNRSGFLRPVPVPGQAPEARASADLAAACPGMTLARDRSEHEHPLWGPVLDSRTGHALDADIRQQGSSGGVLSALAWHLLRSGRVDGVAQIAVSRADPLSNELQISRSREDVLRAAGSRYAPAAPLAGLLEALRGGQRLAFIGKPCDVAALRQYLRRHPELAPQVPVMLSFMCAGVPSLDGTHEVLKAMGADRGRLTSFRYRGDGWPGMARAVHHDGQAFEMDYNTSWGQILGRHLQLRCKICPDGTGEFADITCADAWYGKDGYPDFAERQGRSLVLVRTAAGRALLEQALADGSVATEALDIGDVARMQPYQVTRKRAVLGRALAARARLGRGPRYRGLGLVQASLSGSLVQWLRQAWGTFRRARQEIQ